MNKKLLIIIIAVAVLIGLAAGGYYFWVKKSGKTLETKIENKTDSPANFLQNTDKTAENISESASKGVLPTIQTNPLENKPNLNPADETNPYKNIKTNPFE